MQSKHSWVRLITDEVYLAINYIFRHVFDKFGIKLNSAEIKTLFNEIDKDQSGYVDLDEFVFFIDKNFKDVSEEC